MSLVSRLRNLPKKTKILLLVSLFFIITLPLFIWGLITNKFLIPQKAEVTRVNVDITGAPYLGPVDAPITIVEFGDFQCSLCKTFHDDVLQPLLAAYPNQIKFVWKNFPLTAAHPQAEIAAEAGMCANEQNKFWEMSDAMFNDQTKLTSDDLKLTAANLGLDATQFNTCLDSLKYSSSIQKDISDGTSYGVTGTPTFFINGIILIGAQPLNAFQQIIDSEVATPSPSPTPTPTESPSPAPTETPTASPTGNVANDDVFFIPDSSIVSFVTTGQNPNTSVDPTEIQVGKTYIVNVNFQLQNTLKENYPQDASAAAALLVNNYHIGNTQISVPLIASHRDGASYSVAGVFTATTQNTKVEIVFDPDNVYPETNKNNNSLVFNFAPVSTPSPSPSPTESPSPTPTATPNWCNGTCGSNYNCQGGLFCSNGFCRNPDCPSDNTCGCATPTPTPKLASNVTAPITTSSNPAPTSLAKTTPVPTSSFGKGVLKPTTPPTPKAAITPAHPLAQYAIYGGIAATAIVVIVITIFSIL